jgi:SPX domain protein involved in polyphosphate accumulation
MIQGYTQLNTYRFERKFVASCFTRTASEAVVKQNSAFFDPIFHPRRVNNIYFDTPGLDCYFDNLFGNGERWKARIRWYENRFGHIESPILEFKIKSGLTGTKRSFAFPGFALDQKRLDSRIFKPLFEKADLPEEIQLKMAAMQPVLFNSYLRSYFKSRDKNFRITVDTDMEFYNLRPTWNHFQHVYKEPLKSVIELKYDMEFDREAQLISNELPFRLDKNSKYVAGMSHFRSEIAL